MRSLVIEALVRNHGDYDTAEFRWVDREGVVWSVPYPRDIYPASWDLLVEAVQEVAYFSEGRWRFHDECSPDEFSSRIAKIPHVRVVR